MTLTDAALIASAVTIAAVLLMELHHQRWLAHRALDQIAAIHGLLMAKGIMNSDDFAKMNKALRDMDKQ